MSMACPKCGQQLPLPPQSILFRCQCGNLIPLGNSDRSLPVQEHGRSSSKMRRFRDKFRRNSSRKNSPSTSPRLSLLFTKPPPSGKRALLCGVTYKKEKFRLSGTLHDVNSMRNLLVKKISFSDESILILAEEAAYKPPTRRNVLEAFKWLMIDLKSGDSLVFYFSGHGLQQPDFLDDELDGFDETICPLDCTTKGMITDNNINDILVKPLTPGVTLHAIIDSCHSGTILDLPWVYNREKSWADNRPPSGTKKGTSGGRAIGFSACRDNQLAAETSALSDEKTMMGAMTYTFIKALSENTNITYQGLLDYMHNEIENVNKARCPLLKPFQGKIDQEPMLSSSEKFDTNIKFKL
ncbi:metacaspase-1-like [Lycium barbarum]|uniref:metacaspase-1-like n=1 Tax=Lycium barbarum TaxID=112863 RepID=UPI00293E8F42|nr:metacaspase-1-like [Lycium barbarum]